MNDELLKEIDVNLREASESKEDAWDEETRKDWEEKMNS